MKFRMAVAVSLALTGGTLAVSGRQDAGETAAGPPGEARREGRVELTDARRAAAGIETAACERLTLPEVVHTTGTLETNADRLAHLGSFLPGFVREVTEKGYLGVRVAKGDELAVIHSLEFGETQTAYLKARAVNDLRQKSHDREKDLFERKISSGREFIEAEADLAQAKIDLQAARNRLEVLGLGPEEIDALVAGQAALGAMRLRSPLAGTVIGKHVVRGEHVEAESDLFEIADLDRVWLFADVYERDLARVARGQKAECTLAAWPGVRFAGAVTHVAEVMNAETRTLKVRIEIDNPEGRLKPGMFASVDIAVAERTDVPAVPEAAVQTQRRQTIVFVETAKNVFDRRPVDVGVRFGGRVEIRDGLKGGETVVAAGSFLLKSELEKESFGGED